MKTVVVTGWNVGFQKVKFTDMLRRDFGYSLSNAKSATDGILENQRLELEVQDSDCDRVLPNLTELGAKFAVEG